MNKQRSEKAPKNPRNSRASNTWRGLVAGSKRRCAKLAQRLPAAYDLYEESEYHPGTYIYTYVEMHRYVRTYIRTNAYIHTNIRMYVCMDGSYTCMYECVRICVCMWAFIRTCLMHIHVKCMWCMQSA